MVGRANPVGLVANPYPAPKAVLGETVLCEVCNDRVIKTKVIHKNLSALIVLKLSDNEGLERPQELEETPHQ
jgi:hypothetical protein